MRSNLLRRASLGTAALGVGLAVLSAYPAAAQTTVYSNVDNYSGSIFRNQGATSATGSTTIVADDITPIASSVGQSVTGFSFSLENFNTVAVTVSPTVYFYANTASNAPGALLYSGTFSPINKAAGLQIFNAATNSAGYFALPTTFWAGISFSSTTATLAQLNNFGQGIFTPPTIGTSTDNFFESTGPATAGSNPVGVSNYYFGGTPQANFGWSFQTGAAPVPEASTTVSLGLLLALGMGGLVVASKRKKASVQA